MKPHIPGPCLTHGCARQAVGRGWYCGPCNRAKDAAQQRAYYLTHQDRVRAYQQAWRDTHRERLRDLDRSRAAAARRPGGAGEGA